MIYEFNLLQAIRNEVAPSISKDGKINMHMLLGNIPLLDAAFNADRYLKNKDLSSSPSLELFGGGSTYSSGCFIAKREVMAFVVLAVHLCDLPPKNPEKAFPRMDWTKPTLGTMDPMKADEVILVIFPRSQA